jgi:hypothetical protein
MLIENNFLFRHNKQPQPRQLPLHGLIPDIVVRDRLIDFLAVCLVEVECSLDEFNGAVVILGDPLGVELVAAGDHGHFPDGEVGSLQIGLSSDGGVPVAHLVKLRLAQGLFQEQDGGFGASHFVSLPAGEAFEAFGHLVGDAQS